MDSPKIDAPHKPEFALVSDVMRPAATVRLNATLREVACAMLEHDVEAVAVLDATGSLRGVITAADLTVSDGTLVLAGVHNPRMHGLWFAPEDLLESAAAACTMRLAASFMRRWFTTADPTEHLSAVVQRMMKDGTQHAFVLGENGLVGMISAGDLLHVIAAGPRPFAGPA